MKTAGIIGGIGPESTAEYYRLIIAGYREQMRDGSYPLVIINSIDLKKMIDLIVGNDLVAVTEYLVGAVEKLAKAGADFGVLAANTPHVVFDDIRRRSPIPLISIVEETCKTAKALGLTTLGLLGTRFTMQGRFYPEVFSREKIMLVTPQPDEQAYIHDKYMNELVEGVFRPETRERFLAIIDHLKKRADIQGLILGGTELPLLLRDSTACGIPLLDTTQIHVKDRCAIIVMKKMPDLNEDYIIRPARVSDARVIAEHRAAMFRDMGLVSVEQDESLLRVSEPWVAGLLAKGDYVGWLVEHRKAVVPGGGMLIRELPPTPGCYRVGRWGHIVNVYTDPNHRRRGLARRLMNTILDWCAQHKIDQVTLSASDDGRALYESLGFKPTSDIRLSKPWKSVG